MGFWIVKGTESRVCYEWRQKIKIGQDRSGFRY